jgi:transcriptional regulator of acetoin/glycerol metabolism
MTTMSLHEQQRAALAAWDQAIASGRTDLLDHARDVVAQSWRRSLTAKLDPGLPRAPLILDEEALHRRRERHWVRVAEAALAPHIENIADCNHILTVFDADGCMISSVGAPRTLEGLREIQFMPGATWDEHVVGTNGPGLALALRRPVHVIGAEHFCEAWHPWHCAAVPLFDPETSELLGAVDISGEEHTAHPYALALATALARTVEQALLLHQRSQAAAQVAQTSHSGVTVYPGVPRRDAAVLARVAAGNRLPVLVLGESGVGKEVVAQSIHAHSLRAAHPFIAVNCGAIPGELIESELFGYAPGAFSGAQRTGAQGKFAAADGGTLFLDELCDLPLPAQAALLRVLQERQVTPVGSHRAQPVDVRVIAATNRDPRAEVAAGRFRADLYYRLNVLSITLPPLRARGRDILVLARKFLQLAQRETGRRVVLGAQSEQALVDYAWPGNVRELENLMFRLSAVCPGDTVDLADLPTELQNAQPAVVVDPELGDDANKRELIAVVRGAKTMAEAAAKLGITRSTLYRRLERFGLQPKRWVSARDPSTAASEAVELPTGPR